jgi:hypothetical protein
MKVAETGGSGPSSSSLSPYAGGDLQNKQERSKQLILLVFLDLHFSSVLFSSRCGFFLLPMAGLAVAVFCGGGGDVEISPGGSSGGCWFSVFSFL